MPTYTAAPLPLLNTVKCSDCRGILQSADSDEHDAWHAQVETGADAVVLQQYDARLDYIETWAFGAPQG